jgi:hypothetical protein
MYVYAVRECLAAIATVPSTGYLVADSGCAKDD